MNMLISGNLLRSDQLLLIDNNARLIVMRNAARVSQVGTIAVNPKLSWSDYLRGFIYQHSDKLFQSFKQYLQPYFGKKPKACPPIISTSRSTTNPVEFTTTLVSHCLRHLSHAKDKIYLSHGHSKHHFKKRKHKKKFYSTH